MKDCDAVTDFTNSQDYNLIVGAIIFVVMIICVVVAVSAWQYSKKHRDPKSDSTSVIVALIAIIVFIALILVFAAQQALGSIFVISGGCG